MNMKNQVIIEDEQDGKKFGFFCENGTTYGMIYDFSMKLRQFALEKINENPDENKEEEKKDEDEK